jgi:hypothetical protein
MIFGSNSLFNDVVSTATTKIIMNGLLGNVCAQG